jgi:hypothetical protein
VLKCAQNNSRIPKKILKKKSFMGEKGCSRAQVPGEGVFDGKHPLTDSSGRMIRPRCVRDESGRVCGCRVQGSGFRVRGLGSGV